jgi:hypothetical protein
MLNGFGDRSKTEKAQEKLNSTPAPERLPHDF